jgi:hypothetical protein
LSGEETISYYNNSPDTLNKIIIRLYPDYYKKGVERNYPIDAEDENEGTTIEALKIGKEDFSFERINKQDRDGTNLILKPEVSLLPKSKTEIKVKWHYTVNTGSQNRTGRIDSTSWFIAYFFPRISVYDDIDGWDDWSYSGIQEFYNDFGNFNVNIHAPENYVVWATGDLQNGSDVLTKKIMSKLDHAASSSIVTHVIDSNDYKAGKITAQKKVNTWKFVASNVTDFVFALSDHYLWDACSLIADNKTGRRVLVQTAFNPKHKDYFDVINIAVRSIDIMNDTFPAYPFPFPHETIIDGTDEMEYPMMVNDNPTDSREDAVQLTSHEIFHSYFPFFMGINETKYAWMDEGWATIGESVISPILGEPEDDGIWRKSKFENEGGTWDDLPMISNSKLQSDADYYNNSYGKPAVFYWMLRDLLGDEVFFKCLHAYMNQWNGKHPTPYDFLFTFNTVSGENLDWFWKPWLFDWGYPDLSIKSVEVKNGNYTVTIERKGNIPVPIDLTINLVDGSKIHTRETAVVWKEGKTIFISKTKINSEIVSISLGDDFIPDSFRDDNFWKK